jgi:hypothetical protein
MRVAQEWGRWSSKNRDAKASCVGRLTVGPLPRPHTSTTTLRMAMREGSSLTRAGGWLLRPKH